MLMRMSFLESECVETIFNVDVGELYHMVLMFSSIVAPSDGDSQDNFTSF